MKQSCLSLCMTPFVTEGDQNFTVLQLRNIVGHAQLKNRFSRTFIGQSKGIKETPFVKNSFNRSR